MISSSVSIPILENLVNCPTASDLWATLCSLYQHESKGNIYMIQNNFFKYKMCAGDSINTHINKVLNMGKLLKDLGQPIAEEMFVTKFVCGLPPSYNNIIAAWTDLHALEQMISNLKVRQLQIENLLALQGINNTIGNSTFFTHSNKPSS